MTLSLASVAKAVRRQYIRKFVSIKKIIRTLQSCLSSFQVKSSYMTLFQVENDTEYIYSGLKIEIFYFHVRSTEQRSIEH